MSAGCVAMVLDELMPKALGHTRKVAIVAKQIEAIPRLLMDAHDTAKALSISERKLWELTSQGDIPCVRIGRRTLYDPRALAAWVDGQLQGGGLSVNSVGSNGKE